MKKQENARAAKDSLTRRKCINLRASTKAEKFTLTPLQIFWAEARMYAKTRSA